jgi:hypothetical protein
MPPDSHATTARIESVIRELYSIALSALADFWDFDYKFPINLFNRQRRNQMKIQKGGKTVTIAREELETLVTHVAALEKIVKALESQDAAGKLPLELQRAWASLKKVLDAEEAKAAGSGPTPRARKVRCCILHNEPLTNLVKCRQTNTTYAFALAACVAEALLGGFSATLVAGTCASVDACP